MFDVIVTCLQLLSTIVIGLIVAYIAYQQWRTNHYRLKLDLYEKRYKVYEALKKLTTIIFMDGKIDNKDIDIFMSEIREADFLFNDDIVSYLHNKIYKKALKLHVNQMQLCGENRIYPKPEPSAISKEISELTGWFAKEFYIAKNKFKKYLDFKKII